jgi:acetylornithine deacetylase/succinyl-diaminopimelate desuccinylase-like protein
MPDTEPRWDEIFQNALNHLVQLVRLDTTNPPGNEHLVADYVATVCREMGLEPRVVARTRGRDNVVARIAGDGSEKPILLASHADVVPAEPGAWTHPPFSADVADGCVWGRGTIDMKSGTAMHLAAMQALVQLDIKRDVILAVVADEETGMDQGSRFLVDEHPDLVRAEYALGEVGGFSTMVMGRRIFPVQVAEKGLCWIKATTTGAPGHGSVPNRNSAVVQLARAVARLGSRRLPIHVTEPAREYLGRLGDALPGPGRVLMTLLGDARSAGPGLDLLMRKPEIGRPLLAALTNTVTPTILRAGEKINVVPSRAEVMLDGRTLPGHGPGDLVAEIKKIAPELELEVIRALPAVQASPFSPVFRSIERALLRHASDGAVVPYLLPGMTDAKSWSILGTRCYGFMPMLLPDGFPHITELIHGHDERIPLTALEFGTRVFYEVLAECCT